MNKDTKKQILKAYFEGRITKDDLRFIFEFGLICPPILWIYSSEKDQRKHERKQELAGKVLGYTPHKLEWVKNGQS